MVEPTHETTLTRSGRLLMLLTAFLGWFFAGFHLSITSVAMPTVVFALLDQTGEIDLDRYQGLSRQFQNSSTDSPESNDLQESDRQQFETWRSLHTRWFSWTQCSFLFGAAMGGLLFGSIGDRFGRTRGMGCAILTYSMFSAATYFAASPLSLCLTWFLACLGVGGMWPNGVALVSEAWSSLSRPLAAGVIGTAANIGILLMSTIATYRAVTPTDWQWVMLVAASPVILGIFSLIVVPESPRWHQARLQQQQQSTTMTTSEIFRPPLLKVTLLGIFLATVPTIGAWGSANWMVPWAAEAGEAATPPNPILKAQVNQYRSMTGIIGSLLGGWIASLLGRRTTYCLTSLGALFSAQYTFWCLHPTDPTFLAWVAALGFFSGIYFGWLPLCLPELFPTRARSAGAGVSFNFGRILTAVTIFVTGTLTQVFAGDFAGIGRVTSLIFAGGVLLIFFIPDTSQRQLED